MVFDGLIGKSYSPAIWESFIKEEWKEGHKEGLKEGQETGFIKSVYIQKVLNNTLSIAQAADMLNMTAEEFQELMDSYQELQASIECKVPHCL